MFRAVKVQTAITKPIANRIEHSALSQRRCMNQAMTQINFTPESNPNTVRLNTHPVGISIMAISAPVMRINAIETLKNVK